MKPGLIILLTLFLNAPSFAQWKSYYPEGKSYNQNKDKVDGEKNQKIFENYLFKGLKAKSLEDYEEALGYFEKCITIDDTKALPFYESAKINKEAGRYSIAVEQVKKAIKLNSNNRWYLLLHAEILFSKQDFKNSAIQYKKLITLEPGNEELYFKLSDIYIYSNNFDKAIEIYNDLQKYKGVDKTLSMQKHKLYRERNNIQGAINELVVVLNEFPDDVEILEILSELYLLNDQKEQAFELFKRLSVLTPNKGRIHLTLADYYRENGENHKSFQELKLAFKSTKLNIDTKVRILISYYQLITINEEMKGQAYELANLLIKTHPEDLKARAVFADILYTDNQYQKAKEQYLHVLEKDKSKSQVWSQVLFIQAEQQDFEGMIQTSKEALEYFPLEPLFYYFNGVSNKWFKDYEASIKSLERGIEFVVENEKLLLEFYISLADVYHLVKENNSSDEFYEKALNIDPNNLLVLNNYSYYLSLRKTNLKKAKEMSFRCNELEPENGTYQDTYAWVLYQLKEYKSAKKWLLKALINGGEKSAVVVEHYGDVLYKLGEKNEAINQWEKAKKLGGDSGFIDKKIREGEVYE